MEVTIYFEDGTRRTVHFKREKISQILINIIH